MSIVKILFVALLSSVKFITAAPLAFAYGMNYFETLLITAFGGILGVLFFFYLSRWLIAAYVYSTHHFYRKQRRLIAEGKLAPTKKKIFTWRNRMIVRIVKKFGLLGIAALTPTLLSIPLGTFIAARYFGSTRKVIAYLCISVVCWALIMSSIVVIF